MKSIIINQRKAKLAIKRLYGNNNLRIRLQICNIKIYMSAFTEFYARNFLEKYGNFINAYMCVCILHIVAAL